MTYSLYCLSVASMILTARRKTRNRKKITSLQAVHGQGIAAGSINL